MTQAFARLGAAALTLILFFGTLMPGSWKHAGLRALHSPLDLSAMAHVALFAGLCFLLPLARPWALRPWHVPALALALALTTEGLQFFAIDRHPSLSGLAQDMAGALIGWAAARAWQTRLSARGRPQALEAT